MKKGDLTRDKLVAATATLLQRQGFHGTTLLDIVHESGAPRGSLYFHFPEGKEALACAALEGAGGRWRELIEGLVAGAPHPGDAVYAVCEFLATSLEASNYSEGCPLATVGLEAASTSEQVRATVARHYDGWIESISRRLEGLGAPHAEAERFATFTLSAIEGALLLSKVKRSTKPLRDVGEMLRGLAQGNSPRDRRAPR